MAAKDRWLCKKIVSGIVQNEIDFNNTFKMYSVYCRLTWTIL